MTDMITIGVAIAIPEPHATVLSEWRRRVGDPEASRIPTHVTLLPPTEFAQDELAKIEDHLAWAAEQVGPFVMRLSSTGTFRPVSQVVFVQVSAGIAECELLERAVRKDPIVREVEFPYHPHVTVAHDIGDAALDEAFEALREFVAQFRVASFVMYCQDPDRTWHARREFALTGS
ncbi:2'-5' RNA ligase family protein [Jatrophihabitans telluris]|uniref:2'-5' RNA ligase family protein n=1 Tax=Jatrophihabitans telluris TaxID=2038343 RepID=A0ABY4QVY3_9ACTN|nr:2'-5' RNA ligase family protein [Jatrophihabitans telluris]UQX87821.1 2'-5' RNA ligase family protein [Jatrophihabitans telluris]